MKPKARRILVDKVACRAGHTIERKPGEKDDTAFIAEIVRHYMKQHRYCVRVAADATAALIAREELAL